MRRRARRIRRAVAALAVTLFASAFLIVYVQLASGHDPALAANAAKRRTTAVSASQSSAAEAPNHLQRSQRNELRNRCLLERRRRIELQRGIERRRRIEPGEESSAGASAVTTSQS